MVIENMQAIENIVRNNLARLTRGSDPDSIDLAAPLAQGLGLSSLDLVILLTSACKEAKVPMTTLSEHDVSNIRSGQDLVQMLTAKLTSKGEQDAVA